MEDRDRRFAWRVEPFSNHVAETNRRRFARQAEVVARLKRLQADKSDMENDDLMDIKINTDSEYFRGELAKLKAGDVVYLSGTVYTARDQAHKRLCEVLDRGEKLPFDIEDACIYYVGPSPASPGRVLGSAGPTTSYRMDPYAPQLMAAGQAAMIGKGPRSEDVVNAIKDNDCVYFAAVGGAGALLSRCITESEIIAYPDLGAEAVRRLTVEDMPLIVAIDSQGMDLYRKENR